MWLWLELTVPPATIPYPSAITTLTQSGHILKAWSRARSRLHMHVPQARTWVRAHISSHMLALRRSPSFMPWITNWGPFSILQWPIIRTKGCLKVNAKSLLFSLHETCADPYQYVLRVGFVIFCFPALPGGFQNKNIFVYILYTGLPKLCGHLTRNLIFGPSHKFCSKFGDMWLSRMALYAVELQFLFTVAKKPNLAWLWVCVQPVLHEDTLCYGWFGSSYGLEVAWIPLKTFRMNWNADWNIPTATFCRSRSFWSRHCFSANGHKLCAATRNKSMWIYIDAFGDWLLSRILPYSVVVSGRFSTSSPQGSSADCSVDRLRGHV